MLTVGWQGFNIGSRLQGKFVTVKDGRIQHEDQLPLPVLGVPVHPHPHHQLHHPVDHEQCPVWFGKSDRQAKNCHSNYGLVKICLVFLILIVANASADVSGDTT